MDGLVIVSKIKTFLAALSTDKATFASLVPKKSAILFVKSLSCYKII